ncbi:sirohydrochlorin chelatase [Aeromicrobium flavum]|uniref:sirohydrochlorin chelatase n=1 Tax=Aeromicrobium flavum TaxID=416568 RepID=UPI0011BD5283|nr:CbiX/SirB N-terminal domain-containing protein [Aeromicrobium flavum]
MRTRIIVCSHGTTSHQGRSAIASLVNSVRRHAQGAEVVDAFVDVQQPSLGDVVAETSGPRVIVPLVLTHDVAATRLLQEAAADDPRVRVAPAMGPDWVLAEIGVRRLIEAGARPSDTIVMVAPHADGPRALADVSKAARLLSAVWGGPVHVGVVDGVGTPVDEALDVARAHNQRVVVSMYALASGEGASAIGRLGADVVTAPLLGAGAPDQRLVSLALERADVLPFPGELGLASH